MGPVNTFTSTAHYFGNTLALVSAKIPSIRKAHHSYCQRWIVYTYIIIGVGESPQCRV
jgi:hypothetical protein